MKAPPFIPARFLRSLALLCGSFFSLTVLATPVPFNVPAQSAADALLAFSQQAGVEVLFPFDELRSVQSTEVTGRFEPDEALSRLLRGTGLFARRNDSGKFVVTQLARAAGSIRGRILTTSGVAVRDGRVAIPAARRVASTDQNGEFTLAAVPAGKYQLTMAAPGFRPIQIVDVRVTAGRMLNLETQTLQASDELVRLAPQIVEGKFFRHWKDVDPDDFHPQQAAGNIDLPRTADDALPYTIYDRSEIARSGAVNLNEFLRRELVDSDASTRPPEQNGDKSRPEVGFIAGSSNLRLRGYGADETVILVNGRRLPEVVASGLSSTVTPPDVNFIPLSQVQRVEVLSVSASALYTGNPVGGVINIVLRPDANVTEVNTTYTNALGRYDAPESSVSLQHGETLLGGKLHARLSATFTQTMPPNESELGYIRANLPAQPPVDERLHRATPNIRSADLSPLFGPGTSPVTSVAPGADGTGGLAAFNGRDGVRNLALFDSPGGLASTPDSVDYPYGRRQRGASYFGSATYDIFPWLQLGLDGIYTRSVVNRGYNVFAGDLTLGADSPSNPFGRDVVVSLNEFAPRLGENYGEAHLDFYSAVAGLLVRLPSDWRVSADAQYGHSVTQYRGLAGVDTGRWQQLVDDGRYNPLRDTQVYGPPQAFYDRALIYYGAPGKFATLGDYFTIDAALRVTNQSLPLPTGSGALNVGADFRLNHLASYTDERRFGDGSYAEDPTQWAGRTLQRVSAFGELQAPLLPSRWRPRWLVDAEIDLAARYTAADTAAETNLAPTGGVKLDFAGGFSLRGSIATSNRFPTPFLSKKLSGPGGPGVGPVTTVTITDPQRGGERYNVLASDALNPNLRSEAVVTRTAGIVFQRGKVHRFRFATDFADTRKSRELWRLEAQDVMNLQDLYTGRVTRQPLAPGDTHSVGLVSSVLTGNVNLAWRHSQNWTTSFDYAWTECLGGRLDLYGRWSYFQRYDRELLPNSPTVDELSAPDSANLGLMKHRVNFGGGWSNPKYGFGLDGHYYHSRNLPEIEWADQHNRQINPYWQFDAYVQTDLSRWLPRRFTHLGGARPVGLKAQLRVNNIFNQMPPRYANDPSGAGVQSYDDWRRQTYALSLQATF